MQETYEVARSNVALLIKELREKYGMSEEETRYKIGTYGNKKIVIKISSALKKLIDKYLRRNGLRYASLEFFLKKDLSWEALVQADGAESAIFESIISGVIKQEEKAKKVRVNKTLLEAVLKETVNELAPEDRATICKSKVYKNKFKEYVVEVKIKSCIEPFKIKGVTEALPNVLSNIRNKLPEWIACCRVTIERNGK